VTTRIKRKIQVVTKNAKEGAKEKEDASGIQNTVHENFATKTKELRKGDSGK